jgi:predicted PolB exonuclease-like 3'-5' exonuclease
MTQQLQNINLDQLLFVDIETASNKQTITNTDKEYDAWVWKMREEDKLPSFDEAVKLYENKAALYSSFNKIIAISAGIIKDNTIFLTTYAGEESEILESFVDMANKANRTLVFWNAPFDLPTIRKRFFINKLQNYLTDQRGNDSMKKPWTLSGVLDLMDVWKGISYYNESMDEVALALGLDSPKDELKGNEVSKAYWAGKITEIVKYNKKDVITLINIYNCLVGNNIISKIVEKEPKIDKQPIIKDIFNSRSITEEQKKKIINFSKKFTEDEKKRLGKILSAAIFPNKLNLTFLEELYG